jgi:L-threonylcarbamoyladenylate synthase
VRAFERCIAGGGLAVFPTDTLYGIGCRAGDEGAIERLYELKGRPRDKPSALMCFSMEAAAGLLRELGPRTRDAVGRLLPGPVLCVLPDGKGLRVPTLEGLLAPLASVRTTVIQTSANLAGGRDPVRLEDVPDAIRREVDVVLDGGALEGRASTVVDLRRYEEAGEWTTLREGAVPAARIAELLGA